MAFGQVINALSRNRYAALVCVAMFFFCSQYVVLTRQELRTTLMALEPHYY